MIRKNGTRKMKPGLALGLTCFLIIIGILLYYQLLYKSKTVNSNIFKLAFVLTGHKAGIWSAKFSPDGCCIATGSVDSTLKIWDKESGAIMHNLEQPAGITYVSFSPDAKYVATSSYDEKVRLWRLPEGTLEKELDGNKGTLWSVCFSPDGKLIAGSGEDATIKIWNVESGKLVNTLRGHSLNVWDIQFSPDGKTLASGSFDKTIKIWDVASGESIKTLNGHSEAIVAIAFSHDGKILASTSDDKSIKLWDTNDWQASKTLIVPEHIQAVDFSPDDKFLITGGRDKPAMGEFLQNFFGDSKFNKGVSMRLWDVKTGYLLQTFSEHGNDVNDVSFSPDGKWIVSASADKTVELWKRVN